MEKGFRQMLTERQEKVGSLLCVGLDPLPEKVPINIGRPQLVDASIATMVTKWMKWVVDETAQYASMFKPQRAHWEAIPNGETALRSVVEYIKKKYPDIPIFLDCKRGDISSTQARYAEAHFGLDDVDGMNFNPYMGKDTMVSLIRENYPGRGIVGLCYTSNPAAREIQDLELANGQRLWEVIAQKVHAWSTIHGVYGNAGLVMAAAYENPKGSGIVYSDHLSSCRKLVGDDLWFLIPGVGTQGGYVEETVKAAYVGPGSIAINSSSGIIFADRPAEAAEKLDDQIRAAIPN